MGLKVSHLVTLSQVTRGLTRYRNTNLDKFVFKSKLMEISRAKQLLSEPRMNRYLIFSLYHFNLIWQIQLLILIHEKTLLGFFRTPRNRQYQFTPFECSVHYLATPNGNRIDGDLLSLLSIYQKEIESITI